MAATKFEEWVALLAATEEYGNIHQDDPEDQARFWITEFCSEIGGRENESCDYTNDDIEKGMLFNEVVTEFFDD